MRQHEPVTPDPQLMPPLLRFLGLNLALGAAIGVAVVSSILLTNLAGLRGLIIEAQNPFIPLLLLYSFNIITFSSVTMGIGIMTMPLESSRPEDQTDTANVLQGDLIEPRTHRPDGTERP
jgi:hypothetical protein